MAPRRKPRAHDGAAHGVPAVHERQRPRGIGADALDRRPLGPERREVVADAAALLHGERGFLQVLEDRGHVVRDPPHHEAVEERDLPLCACAGEDAAGGQKLEPLQRAVELRLPTLGLRLDRGERTGHPPPAVLDRAVDGRAVGRLQPVLHVPDAGRDGQHLGHGAPAAAVQTLTGSKCSNVLSLFLTTHTLPALSSSFNMVRAVGDTIGETGLRVRPRRTERRKPLLAGRRRLPQRAAATPPPSTTRGAPGIPAAAAPAESAADTP